MNPSISPSWGGPPQGARAEGRREAARSPGPLARLGEAPPQGACPPQGMGGWGWREVAEVGDPGYRDPMKLRFAGFEWSEEKNLWLKLERGLSFEEVVKAIQIGDVLDIREHPNQAKYPGQYLIVVKIRDYAWVVPCKPEGDRIKLFTAYPSRKYTKKFLRQ